MDQGRPVPRLTMMHQGSRLQGFFLFRNARYCEIDKDHLNVDFINGF